MRVLLFSGHFIQYSIELANGLAQQGAEVGIVFHEKTAIKLVGEDWKDMLGEGVTHLAMAGPPTLNPFTRSSFRTFRWLGKAIKKFNPDVIHMQDGNDAATLWMALRNKRPMSVTLHDITAHPGDEKHRGRGLQFMIDHVLMPRARKRNVQFIVHGDKLKADFQEAFHAPASMVHVVPHGILAGFVKPGESLEGHGTGDPPGPALFFGRMERYKGLKVLAEALPSVFERLPEARVIIAGRGEALEEVREQLTAMPQVELRDYFIQTEEVAQLYREASVNLAPYIEASQSGVIAAGYAFGVPSIATRVGALPEVVVDGDNGLMVEPEQPQAMADALVRYLSDADLRAQLSAGVKRWAEGPLSWRSVAEKTLQVYAEARRKK